MALPARPLLSIRSQENANNPSSDSPAWTLTRTGSTTPTTSRDWNTLDLAGALIAVITTPASGPTTTTTIELSNLHEAPQL